MCRNARQSEENASKQRLMDGTGEGKFWSYKKTLKTVVKVMIVMSIIFLFLILGFKIWQSSDKHRVVGAVATDHLVCSEVDRDILAKGGSAVDAAIAALLCVGVRHPHSMGLGGGSVMLVYTKNPRKIEIINGCEYATLAFTASHNIDKYDLTGPLTIAVPPEVQVYWEAHQRYGTLPWRTLFPPAIRMARDGHPMSKSAAKGIRMRSEIFNITISEQFPQLCKYFCNENGEMKKAGDTVKLPELAKTLSGIAKKGPDYLYKGPVARTLLKEINGFGGLMTQADFDKKRVRVEPAMEFHYKNMTMYVPGAPSGGPLLGLILGVLDGFNLTSDDIATVETEAATYHKMIEAFKFSYADGFRIVDPQFVSMEKLLNKMVSPRYAAMIRKKIDVVQTHDTSYYTDITENPTNEQGTAHISVLAPNGDAVSVTSTIDYYFGSLLVSSSTGIILNNVMVDFDDYATPDLPIPKKNSANMIEPGKQSRSFTAPALFVNSQGDPILVLGSSEGSTIPSVNAQVAARVLWFKQSLEDAIRHKRFHNQLFPNEVEWEPGFPQEILEDLHKQYGHTLRKYDNYMAVIQAIHREPETGQISAFSDERKHGKASLLYQSDLSS